jgi:type I restriction enzyme S subunit
MSNKAGKRGLVPKLRFPEFRAAGEWEAKLLGAVCEMQAGKFVAASEISERQTEGLYPCFGGNGLRGYTKMFNQSGRYSLIGRQGALCGNVNLAEGNFYATEHAVVTTPKPGNSTDWLFYNLCLLNLNRFATGQAQPGLSIDVLEKVNCATPKDEKEQQKIADCLASLDELLTLEAQKLDTLKAHKKGLMQQLFPAKGETLPKLRFPEFRDAGEWEISTFGAAATFINGKAYRQEELLDQGKYRVLRVGNFFTNKEWYFSDLELEEDKYCDSGDLLYAWSASFGPRIWTGEKVIYHYHIWKVVEAKGIDKQFLFVLLDYETERMKAESANGLGLLHITKGAIEEWECCIPQEVEQQKIADCLASIDDLITVQTQQLTVLKTHKKGLMQQLFPALDEVLA